MKVSIHAPYAKERLETACQHSILHPEGIVGNPEVIPRKVGEQRASPPQSNSLAAAPASGSAVRCMKMLVRQTVVQEDHDAMRKSGISESQRGPAVWQFRWSEKDLHGSSCPAEKSDCSVRTTGTARRGRTKRGTKKGRGNEPFWVFDGTRTRDLCRDSTLLFGN